MERNNEGELAQRIAYVKEATKKPLLMAESFQLYQDMLAFADREQGKEEAMITLIKFLPAVSNQRVFAAVLSQVIERGAGEQLHQFLVSYLSDEGSPCRESVLDVLLKDRGNHMEKIVTSCRSSLTLTEVVLVFTNKALIRSMRHQAITNVNFTQSVLLALKCVESGIIGAVLQQALRHLLIVDCVQYGEVCKLIMENEQILSQLEKAGRKDSVSGYWYFLIAKLYSNEANRNSPAFSSWVEAAFLRCVGNVAIGSSLREEVDKISFSGFDEKKQIDLLTQLRGLTYFLSTCINIHIEQGTADPRFFTLLQQLMELKDFACFEYVLSVYLEAFSKGSTQLNVNIVRSIQQNCLPIYHSQAQKDNPYNPTEVRALSFDFDSSEGIKISVEASATMAKMLDKVLQWRGCSHKRAICNCCEQYIRATIEKQYDHEFHSHQFMSACHLMCREVARINAINPQQAQAQTLRQYLLDHIKWLLNLSQSCLPKHRRCVSFAIFDLLLVFPPLLARNQFLQDVIADLFVTRFPDSLPHLSRLIALYLSPKDLPLASDPLNDLQKLGQKLLKKCGEESLAFLEKVKIWDLLIRIWEKDEQKLAELLEIYSLHGDHSLAKYLSMKRRKTTAWEELQAKAKEQKQRMELHRCFYSKEISHIQTQLKTV